MKALVDAAVVFVGAGLGGVARYGVQRGGVFVFGDRPWATVVINIVGSLVMGLLFGWLSGRSDDVTREKLFVLTGVLGGFTTFSAFSLDTAQLWQRGDTVVCVAYAAASVVLSLVAVGIGLSVAR